MKRYRSQAGSVVTLTGHHLGIVEIEYDWLEEPEGCLDQRPEFNRDWQDPAIMVSCPCHEPISIPVMEVL